FRVRLCTVVFAAAGSRPTMYFAHTAERVSHLQEVVPVRCCTRRGLRRNLLSPAQLSSMRHLYCRKTATFSGELTPIQIFSRKSTFPGLIRKPRFPEGMRVSGSKVKLSW